jgi:transposase InsO family protein
MEILKNIMEYNDLELPEFSLETYRCCVKDMEEYPRNQKKAKRYRKRFEADAVGQLIQGDVTEYAWIEGAESFKLLMFIDDHSRYVLYADFIEHDDMQAHIRAWKIMLSNYGKPSAVYYDNDSKYRKRVMEKILNPVLVSGLKELDIQVINSTPYMPQGKGKIERKFQTFQKQLIFWFKEKKVKTWDQAREVLKWFVERHNDTESRAIKTTPNDRFKNSPDVFEVLYPKDLEKVEDALSHRMTRKVDDVNEISLDGIKYLIPTLDGMPLAGKVLELRVNPGLWFKAFYRDKFVVKCDIINKKEDDHDKNVA